MPLRSWIIVLGTATGLVGVVQGVGVLAPHWFTLTWGPAVLALTLVYARLTGISWLALITRVLDRRER
jgi:hypothetical protein